MKSPNFPMVASLVVFFCGSAFGVIFSNTQTVAQVQAEAEPPTAKAAPPAPQLAARALGPMGRYQIAAYATGSSYGCFLVDTANGDVWRTERGNTLRPVRK